MRKYLPIITLVAVCGCQQNVRVPTVEELKSDHQLLADWKRKCEGGEYSHLPTDQKNNFCFTTQEASRSIAVTKTGDEEAAFFEANTRRKK